MTHHKKTTRWSGFLFPPFHFCCIHSFIHSFWSGFFCMALCTWALGVGKGGGLHQGKLGTAGIA